MRIGVIGVGIIGASVGWHLVNHGAEVVMIDAGRPGEGFIRLEFSWADATPSSDRFLRVPQLPTRLRMATAS